MDGVDSLVVPVETLEEGVIYGLSHIYLVCPP